MNKNPRIREAHIDDLPTLLAFEQALIAYERPLTPTIKEGEISYYNIEAYIQDPEICVLVATVEDTVIASGYALVKQSAHYKKTTHFAYLGFMYTLPAFRGNGINQLIINQLMQWAAERNLTEVQLEVFAENKSAIRAYEKVGFRSDLIAMRIDNPNCQGS